MENHALAAYYNAAAGMANSATTSATAPTLRLSTAISEKR
jgi:hypothetical protein